MISNFKSNPICYKFMCGFNSFFDYPETYVEFKESSPPPVEKRTFNMAFYKSWPYTSMQRFSLFSISFPFWADDTNEKNIIQS